MMSLTQERSEYEGCLYNIKNMKTFITVLLSAIISYFVYQRLELEGMMLVLFCLGIYVAVGLLVEIILKLVKF